MTHLREYYGQKQSIFTKLSSSSFASEPEVGGNIYCFLVLSRFFCISGSFDLNSMIVKPFILSDGTEYELSSLLDGFVHSIPVNLKNCRPCLQKQLIPLNFFVVCKRSLISNFWTKSEMYPKVLFSFFEEKLGANYVFTWNTLYADQMPFALSLINCTSLFPTKEKETKIDFIKNVINLWSLFFKEFYFLINLRRQHGFDIYILSPIERMFWNSKRTKFFSDTLRHFWTLRRKVSEKKIVLLEF